MYRCICWDCFHCVLCRILLSRLSTVSGNIHTSEAFAVSFTITSSSCGFTSSASAIGDDAYLNMCICVSAAVEVWPCSMRMICEYQIMSWCDCLVWLSVISRDIHTLSVYAVCRICCSIYILLYSERSNSCISYINFQWRKTTVQSDLITDCIAATRICCEICALETCPPA